MGFRSTFVTDDISIEWPTWFVDKWQDWVHFVKEEDGAAKGCISSKAEAKCYGTWEELPNDIQKAVIEKQPTWMKRMRLLFFHECGGCSCFDISTTDIVITEPVAWREKDGVGHYGCGECHKDYGY